MRIRRICVRDYAGIDEAEVTFPDTGITIIEGVNEVGKTSLIAAVDAILKYPDSSSARDIKEAMTVGKDVGPEVEIDVLAGPYEFTYRKRWLRSAETVLEVSAPVHEQASGRKAHDRVNEILDEAVDLELWKALRLEQGVGLSQARFDIPALGKALDAAAGGDFAGDREDVLVERIEAEYLEYWTPGGHRRSTVREVEENVEAAEERAAAAAAHLETLDGYNDEIRRLDAAASDLERARADAEAVVAELSEQVEAISMLRALVERSKGELERAELVLATAKGDRERRDELISAVEDAAGEVERLEGEIAQGAPLRQIVQTRYDETQRRLDAARRAVAEARATYDRARDDSEYRRQLIEIEQLTERRDRVANAQAQLDSAETVLDEITIDADLLEQIEEAHLAFATASAAAVRSQPTADLKALDSIEVVVDGTATRLQPDDDLAITVAGETRLVITDVVEMVIRAGQDDSDATRQVEAARERYDGLCERAGVGDFAQAREHADARAQAEKDREDALKIFKQDRRDLTFEGLSRKVERLTIRTEQYAKARPAEPPIPPDHDAAQAFERAAREAVGIAEEAFDAAEIAAQEATSELAEFDVEDASLRAQMEIATSVLASAETRLADARALRSDDELRDAESAAAAAVESAKQSVSTAQGELDAADPDTTDVLLINARAVRQRSAEDLRGNEERRNELRIQLSMQTEMGPARDADEAVAALEDARRVYDRTRKKAEAAKLLHDVFKKHRDAARQRYLQPFRERIERFGRIVYGQTFEVALNDDLSITRRTLSGTTLDFEQLSTGAQEQLGVLSRLACATLVAEDGGAPVIFDDALGWSDPERLDRMGAAISSAADDYQIIILTCVPDRYSAVGRATTVTLN